MRWKPTLIDVLVIAIVVGLIAGLMLSPAGDHDYTHRYPLAPPSSQQIGHEFLRGDFCGWNGSLSILPDGRYSMILHGCLGVHHRESGYVRHQAGTDVLTPTFQKGEQGWKVERTFIPIRWEHRRYLIPPDKMEKFCDAIIMGKEPRNPVKGEFFLLSPTTPVEGLPELPEPWGSDLKKNLAVGKVMSVDGPEVTLNLGAADGLNSESWLTFLERENRSAGSLRVIAVETHSCVAEDHYPGENEKVPEVGQSVVLRRVSNTPTIPNSTGPTP
jgi:hypothetical protein